MSLSVYDTEEPWLRQPCDTDDSWRWLCDYLQQAAPRSLCRLVRGTEMPLGRVLEWCATGAWELRAQAWDAHLGILRLDAVESETGEMARRHARDAMRLQRLGGNELRKLEDASARVDGVGLLSPEAILRFISLGQTLERAAAGALPPGPSQGPDVTKLSLDEARTLRNLYAKMLK